MNFVHNDLKLENLLVDYERNDTLYLIDFGLATRFIEQYGESHVERANLKKFSGNLMFSSRRACRGMKTSRRDDIESAFLILFYLLN